MIKTVLDFLLSRPWIWAGSAAVLAVLYVRECRVSAADKAALAAADKRRVEELQTALQVGTVEFGQLADEIAAAKNQGKTPVEFAEGTTGTVPATGTPVPVICPQAPPAPGALVSVVNAPTTATGPLCVLREGDPMEAKAACFVTEGKAGARTADIPIKVWRQGPSLTLLFEGSVKDAPVHGVKDPLAPDLAVAAPGFGFGAVGTCSSDAHCVVGPAAAFPPIPFLFGTHIELTLGVGFGSGPVAATAVAILR